MKILFFSPFAAIWAHSMPEALLANGLKERGHEIIYVTCNTLYKDYCISMSALGLNEHSDPKKKKKVCSICLAGKKRIIDYFRFRQFNIDARLDDRDLTLADDILKNVNKNNFMSFVHDGFEIGKFASYEFFVHYKKMDLNLTDAEWTAYRIALKNTIYTYLLMKKILGIEKPDRIMIYNSLYSVNRIVKELGEHNQIPVYTHYAGDNQSDKYSTMLVLKGQPLQHYFYLKNDLWPKYKDIPCSKDMLEYVTEHFEALFSQKHFAAYSPARKGNCDVRNFFGIKDNQKILVATMSSYDERFASAAIGITPDYKNLLFPSLSDWVLALADWVKDKKEIFLIIRVHPREFPNRREQRMAPHVEHFKNAMANLPDNAVVNWPDDNISIYDLAEETDVFLNAWSNAGNEMSLLGLPVVIYSKELITYPYDLNYYAENKEEYFNKIMEALNDGWSFDKIKYTYRWYSLLFYRPIVRMVEKKLSPIEKLIYKMRVDKFFKLDFKTKYFPESSIILVESLLNEKKQCLTDVEGKQSHIQTTENEEREDLIEEIRKLYALMYGNTSASKKVTKLQHNFLDILQRN